MTFWNTSPAKETAPVDMRHRGGYCTQPKPSITMETALV